jgi:DNA-binding MarR family transcriptional regulator
MIVLLVHNGFLQRKRHPTDGRRNRLIITSKGKNILNSLRQVITRNRETAIAGLTPEQLNKLKTSLLTISGNCEEDEEFTTVFTLITK